MTKSSKTDCFQLKADFLPITVFRLLKTETDHLQSQLETMVLKAPNYFANAPVIVDFAGLESTESLDTKQIYNLLRQYQIQPIAARGIQSDLANLPLISEAAPKATVAKPKSSTPEKTVTKVITKAVRAGTQVYAKDCDLIILAPINAGAEVIADGHIHAYAPLRGRALAGASGNTQARIFCSQLEEAELVSIAGHYWVSEQMKSMDIPSGIVQLFLEDDQLRVSSI